MEDLISTVQNQLITIVIEEVNLLRGVDAELEKLTDNLQAIQAVLEDAEKRQVMEATVKLWVEKLKDVSYDIDDVLDEWNTALLKQQNGDEDAETKVFSLPTLSCGGFSFCQVGLRHFVAVRIQELNERLADIVNQKNAYNFSTGTGKGSQEPSRLLTTSVIDVSEVFGRNQDTNKIKNMLLSESKSSEGAITPCIISIVGMGGLGKTTLARLAFNDATVESHFDKRIWVCVSDPFDDKRIVKEILESLEGEKTKLDGMDIILEKIREGISGKKILLILDDVWTEDSTKWEPLKNSLLNNASPASRILITTRKEKVAEVMGSRREDMVSIKTLSEEWCWKLFSHLAFSGRSDEDCKNLEGVGKEIVDKCKGLPLAVKTVGSLLRFKKTEQQWRSVRDSKMWEIEEFEEDVFSPLLLSYYDLPSVLKQCFSYCAIFPQDHVIKKDELIKLWMAQGFLNKITQHNKVEMVVGSKEVKEAEDMEMVGEEYFHELAIRSFFQDFERDENGEIVECKMHDSVHSFARFLMEKECLLVKMDGLEEPWKVNLPFKTIRHLTLVMGEEVAFPIPMYNWEKVRSLLTLSSRGNNARRERNLLDNIDKLSCLRTLYLNSDYYHQESIKRLPKRIGKLIHLRYLNLSGNTKLETLPEEICELYNLHILNIRGCTGLRGLPYGIGKLKNLRHLENMGIYKVSYMPKGLKGLSALRTLSWFIVGSDEKSSCKLGDLGELRHLQGSLLIRGMQNVEEASEATEARLSNKPGLRELVLSFDDDDLPKKRVIDGEKEAAIVEALQPPPCLQSLEIVRSRSPTSLFPSWMTSLNMLKSLEIHNCYKWENLPPLGKLSCLESLKIWRLNNVKKVGQEFLGIERHQEEGDRESSSSSTNIVAFPNLKKLVLWGMKELEDWEYGNLLVTNNTSSSSSDGIIIMPRLVSLELLQCEKLKALPHHLFHHLQQLSIRGCPILSHRFEEDWLYIAHIPECNIKRGGTILGATLRAVLQSRLQGKPKTPVQ